MLKIIIIEIQDMFFPFMFVFAMIEQNQNLAQKEQETAEMRKTGIMMTAALLIDVVLCNGILKNLFARVRPCEVNQNIQLLISRPKDYSFPSGHTAISFTAVTVLYLMKEKTLWKSSLLLAILIAFSRMYLYVHYPTDIIGGIVTGVVSGIMGVQLINLFQSRRKR